MKSKKPRLAKHRGKIAVSWYDAQGNRRRSSLGTTSPDEARKLLASFSPPAPRARGTGYIYFIRCINDDGFIKIGFAVSPNDRLINMAVGAPYEMEIIRIAPGTIDDEKALHNRFRHAHQRGEWFRPTPDLMELLCSLPKIPIPRSPLDTVLSGYIPTPPPALAMLRQYQMPLSKGENSIIGAV